MQGTTKSKPGPANSRYIEEFNNKYNLKNTTGYNDFTRSNRYKKSLIEYSEYSKKNKGSFDSSYVSDNLDSTYENNLDDDYYDENQYNIPDYSTLDNASYNNQTSIPSNNSNIIDYNKERTYYANAAKKNNIAKIGNYSDNRINSISKKSSKHNTNNIEKGRASKLADNSQQTDKSKRASKFQKIESIEKLQKADRAKKYTSSVSAHNPANYSNVTSTKVTNVNANSTSNSGMTASAKDVTTVKSSTKSTKATKVAKNTETMQQQSNNTEYVYGNVALQLEPVRKPQTPEERRTHRHVEKNREKAFAMNLPTIACLTIVIMVAFTICIQYLSLQSTIRVRLNNIKQMQGQLETMITDNNVLELNISNSTDLNSVYQRATEEFGMAYPSKDQIVTYDPVESEYVRQYDNIPTD